MSISIIVDIAFIIIIAIFAIVGLVRGFAKSLIKFIARVGSVALAILVASPFATIINSIFGANKFFGGIIGNIFNGFGSGFSTAYEFGLGAQDAIKEATAAKPGGILEFIYHAVFYSSGVPSGGTIGGTIGSVLGSVVTIIIAAVVAYIIIRLVVYAIQRFLYKVVNFTIFGGLDKILGFVLGGAQALVIIAFGFVILSGLTLTIPAVDQNVTPVMENTVVVNKVYAWVDKQTEDYVGAQLQTIANNLFKNQNKDAKQKTIQYFANNISKAKSVYVTENKVFVLETDGVINQTDDSSAYATSTYFVNYSPDTPEQDEVLSALMGAGGTSFELIFDTSAGTTLQDGLLTYMIQSSDKVKEIYIAADAVYFRTATSIAGINPDDAGTLTGTTQFYIVYSDPDFVTQIQDLASENSNIIVKP